MKYRYVAETLHLFIINQDLGPSREVDTAKKVDAKNKSGAEERTLRTAEAENPLLPIEENHMPVDIELVPNRGAYAGEKVNAKNKAFAEPKALRTAEAENLLLPIEVNYVPMNDEMPNDTTSPNAFMAKTVPICDVLFVEFCN